jgi:hypothetical protein
MADLLNKFYGHTIIADETFVVPQSSEGWICNNTDVSILLTFATNTSVQLAVGQTHNWSKRNNHEFQPIIVTVAAMTEGFVGCCWSN